MNLTAIFLVAICFHASARGHAQKINLVENNVPMEKVFRLIKKQTDYTFVYTETLLRKARRVSVNVSNGSIEQVLKICFENQPLTFSILNKMVIIKEKELPMLREVITTPITQAEIRGRVLSANGEPLAGATVTEKGTSNTVMTDAQGNFVISTSSSTATLVISYVGFTSKEVAVANQSNISISLVQSAASLTDVVVVGYGTQRRKDVTGAISSVKGEDIARLPVASVTQALQGQAAGVEIVTNSGSPGANVSVRIRGVGSVNSTDPLYVVDGLPIFGGLNQINPNDIESIDVLKDASAGAIYGARAANGVVIITTKKGKEGPLQVRLSSYYGSQTPWRKLDLLNAEQYKTLYTEAVANAGGATTVPPAFTDPERAGINTNWQDLMLQSAPIQSHNLSLSGGGRFATFNISGGYFRQDGILNKTRYDRANLQVSAQGHKGRFRFGESFLIAGDLNRPEPFYIGSSMFSHIINGSPLINPINPNNLGGYGGAISTTDRVQFLNPYGYTNLVSSRSRGLNILGSMYGQFEVIKGLNYRLNVGTDIGNGTSESFTPTFNMGANTNTTAELDNNSSTRQSWLFEHTLNYRSRWEKHDFTILGGYTEQYLKNSNFGVRGRGFPPSNNIRVLGAASSVASLGGGITELRLRSLIARANYSFDDKYLLTATVRRDASSNFSKNNRWGTFPAISAAWVASEEDFLQNIGPVSYLKLRASYGILGNQAIGAYNYTSVVNLTSNYVLGTSQTQVSGSAPRAFPADSRWEETKQTDVGIEVGLLEDRLMLVADYFNKETSGMLLAATNIPYTAGLPDFPAVNAGGISNKGFELALTFNSKAASPFSYNLTGNLSTYKNEVVSLTGNNQPLFAPNNSSTIFTKTEVGSSVGRFYGYVADGIYQNESEINATFAPNAKPGDIRFADLDKDGKLTENDRAYIGSPLPKFSYGFNANLGYKGFDFSMLWFGISGNDIVNTFIPGMNVFANTTTEALKRWTPQNTNTNVPRAVIGDPNFNSTRFSSRWIQDGSFLRLRNLTVGYRLPISVTDRIKLSGVRVYVSGQNLLTITNYEGFDPEVAGGSASASYAYFVSGNLARGIDRGTYPLARTILGGIQIDF